MPCSSPRSAIPNRASRSAAKYCAKNSTPQPATPRAPCSPGTAEPTPPTQPKSWPASSITCKAFWSAAVLPPLCSVGTSPAAARIDIHNMATRLYLRLAEFLVAATLAIALLSAWRADRRDRAQLAADLAAANQTLAQASSRQHDRDAQLLQTLAALAAEKRVNTTPAQILRELPKQIPLPVPVTLQPAK